MARKGGEELLVDGVSKDEGQPQPRNHNQGVVGGHGGLARCDCIFYYYLYFYITLFITSVYIKFLFSQECCKTTLNQVQVQNHHLYLREAYHLRGIMVISDIILLYLLATFISILYFLLHQSEHNFVFLGKSCN